MRREAASAPARTRLAKAGAALLCAAALSGASAAPQLATQAELVADGELKAKVLAGARGLPPPTPESHTYTLTRGSETRTVKWYGVDDIWRIRALAGTWKDRKGNEMRLARVRSLPPRLANEFGAAMASREDIEKALDEEERGFQGTQDELDAWEKAWKKSAGPGANAAGRFAEPKSGLRYYIEISFAEPVKEQDAQKLLKAAASSLSATTGGTSANNTSMKWWRQENGQYVFWTDLDRAKGGKFIKDAMGMMAAMRDAYERYVPPQKPVGKCTVRIFKTLAEYREYLQGTSSGELDFSCGLWDPSREELLIAAEDVKAAQQTMRHEAFHQYLYYATGRGDHALWFNEGHACFFENVKYNAATKSVRVLDEGNRAKWTEKDPAAVAAALGGLAGMDRAAFYSGDVNGHYVASWALTYFLERGAYASEEFAAYRAVVPAYLKAMRDGASPDEATRRAWAAADGRDIQADFLKFWTKLRSRAQTAREKAESGKPQEKTKKQ